MTRVELLMALAILFIAGFVLDSWTPQPAARYLLTVAVVDHRTVTLEDNRELLLIDRAEHDGLVYSDKAPYQPLIATPAYGLFRAVGGDAFPRTDEGPRPGSSFHWGRWWVTFWSSTIPAMVLVVMLRRLVHQSHPSVAAPVALALSLGTMLLPFAGALFGHVLSAAFLTGGWLLIRRSDPGLAVLFSAGVLLAAAVGTEYPLAIPVGMLFIVALAAHGVAGAVALAAGGAVGAIPLMLYNWLVFDNPFSVSYQGHLPNFQGSGALGVYNLVGPQADELREALIGDRGLLTLTPVALVAVLFSVRAVLTRSPIRRDGLIALVVLVTMWLMSAGIDSYGGSSPGPRYLVPVIPFLAVPLADAWAHHPRVCAGVALFGTVAMTAATMTFPLIDAGYPPALRVWLDLLADGVLIPSVVGELLGPNALYISVALGLGFAIAAISLDRRRQSASAIPHLAAPNAGTQRSGS